MTYNLNKKKTIEFLPLYGQTEHEETVWGEQGVGEKSLKNAPPVPEYPLIAQHNDTWGQDK